jgi:hypothetical protein
MPDFYSADFANLQRLIFSVTIFYIFIQGYHLPKTPVSGLCTGHAQRKGSLRNGAILYRCTDGKKCKIAELLF